MSREIGRWRWGSGCGHSRQVQTDAVVRDVHHNREVVGRQAMDAEVEEGPRERVDRQVVRVGVEELELGRNSKSSSMVSVSMRSCVGVVRRWTANGIFLFEHVLPSSAAPPASGTA